MNMIILFIHGVDIGIARIITISISKIINKIINRKNCSENGFREDEFRAIPHSNDEFFSVHLFIIILINMGISNIIIIIAISIVVYIVIVIMLYMIVAV